MTPLKRLRQWCAAMLLLGVLALLAPLPASAAAGLGSFTLEQVYVNVPEMDVFLYASDAEGAPLSPKLVRAAGVELRLGSTPVDIGNIQRANEATCYIFALDNSTAMSDDAFTGYRRAISRVTRDKNEQDQIMIYTLAGGVQCVLPATSGAAEITEAVRGLERAAGSVDMAQAAAAIYTDIQSNFQGLAPRKALFTCTDAMSLLDSLPLVGSLMTDATDRLNMAFSTFVVTEHPEQLETLAQFCSGKLIPCKREDLIDTVMGRAAQLASALEIKTAISEDFYGPRLETLTLSVPSLGSAVTAGTTVYMGHKLAKPAPESITVTGHNTIEIVFNQAVSEATAGLPGSYRLQSEDAWNYSVPVRGAKVSASGRTVTLTTDTLYEGQYSLRVRNVAARLSAANVSAGGKTMFAVRDWPRDRAFYMARLRVPALVLALLLLWLAVRAFGRSRKDRAAEKAAEVAHLLAGTNSGAGGLPRRWLTMFVRLPGAITETRWTAMVESSLLVGSDSAQCDLCVPDDALQPQHCVFVLDGGDVLLQPIEKARIHVNGNRIAGEYRLHNDDVIRMGHTLIRVVL